MSKKSGAQPSRLAIDAQRAAERELNDAVENAKRLKARSRELKRKVKDAKKAAREASKAARAARKDAEKARRAYKKTVERGTKKRKKTAKARAAITTPKRTTASRNQPRTARSRERGVETARGAMWDVGEDAAGTEVPESELDSEVPVAEE